MAPTPLLLTPDAVAKHGIHIGKNEAAFRENSATIVMPSKAAAFLNPVQEFNRDLSTLAIITWSERLDAEKRQRFIDRKRRRGPEAKRARTEDREYQPYHFTALEALAATGLRSIRYAKEIPLLKSIVANDLAQTAVQAMERNLALNFPPGKPLDEQADLEDAEDAERNGPVEVEASGDTDTDATAAAATAAAAAAAAAPQVAPSARPPVHPDCKVKVNHGNAISLMYNHMEVTDRFDMVDLDPYGTAAPFLDAAVQSVSDGGLLCVTCTDLAVLAGHNYPEKCWSLYGGVSIKAEYSHEAALRLVLHAIASAAGRYGRYIQPMLSLSIDFYLRVFVRVWTRPETVKLNASQTSLVYTCTKCSDWHSQPVGRATEHQNEKTGATMVKCGSASGPPTDKACAQCGGSFHLGGPMWFGPLHDESFCDEVIANLDKHNLGTAARIRGMVSTARDELAAPFYFHPAKVAGLFHCSSPALAPVVNALLNAGYDASRSHCVAGSLKTNAPRGVVYDIFREWIKRNPVNKDRLKEGSPAAGLLARESSQQFDFDTTNERTDAVINGSGERLVRYQMNPQANWGPGTAAKGHATRIRRSFAPSELARRAELRKQ
ncbi:methylamine--glutamate N-methyltransferase [Malassezia cuniculi]|uniref:tRNA (guanine(26)-N(2))-dimethyltransferase n=1 Tax=Malassezia cuniculi TaxID=948313 RepID=A0AAF0ET15_9BASI|nr:methylamine--glutamate N-methyltransferase [Malassezia cuniculi]